VNAYSPGASQNCQERIRARHFAAWDCSGCRVLAQREMREHCQGGRMTPAAAKPAIIAAAKRWRWRKPREAPPRNRPSRREPRGPRCRPAAQPARPQPGTGTRRSGCSRRPNRNVYTTQPGPPDSTESRFQLFGGRSQCRRNRGSPMTLYLVRERRATVVDDRLSLVLRRSYLPCYNRRQSRPCMVGICTR